MPNTHAGTYDPRRTSIQFYGNCVEVNGQQYYTKRREGQAKQIDHHGLRFESKSEIHVAELLTRQGIGYRHHVRFPLLTSIQTPDSIINVFSPDFLFDKPYLWPDEECPTTHHWLIHGLELKGRSEDKLPHQICRQLADNHNVHIFLLHKKDVMRFKRAGALPLELYNPPEDQLQSQHMSENAISVPSY
ncbi:MAG: hypothetical protein AAB424_01790 [Patescibacteria group bacterium]